MIRDIVISAILLVLAVFLFGIAKQRDRVQTQQEMDSVEQSGEFEILENTLNQDSDEKKATTTQQQTNSTERTATTTSG